MRIDFLTHNNGQYYSIIYSGKVVNLITTNYQIGDGLNYVNTYENNLMMNNNTVGSKI